jgi:hypothetical protein
MPLPRARVVKKGLEDSLADLRRNAGAVVGSRRSCARPFAARRPSNSRVEIPGGGLQCELVARFRTAETSEGALARTVKPRRLACGWSSARRGAAPARSHCATCSSSALTLTTSRAAPPWAKASMSFTSRIELLQAADGLFGAAREISGALRPGRVICEAYKQRGRERGADLMREPRRQLSPRVRSRCCRARNACIKCDSVTSVSSTTSPP